MTSDWLERMRQDWDARAREDAQHFIAEGLSGGVGFALSGLDDAHQLLQDVHGHLGDNTTVLEIGCGIGRLLRFLALVFPEVHGIDVSEEMVRQGRDYCANFANVHLHVGDGQSLAPIANESIDFVYSTQVFQHIPDLDIIGNYVAEAHRVLRPGGLFKYLIKANSWDCEQGTRDTWLGTNVSRDDISKWNQQLGWEEVAAYSLDEHLAWIVTRKPDH